MAQLTNRQLLEQINHNQQQQTIEFYKLKDTVTEMDFTIRGTQAERESGKGGMANQVQQNSECIHAIKKKQYKITTWGIVIVTALNLALLAAKSFLKNG